MDIIVVGGKLVENWGYMCVGYVFVLIAEILSVFG